MNNRILSFFATLSFLLLLWQPASAADMRGFGTVQATALPAGAGMKFACDSPAHATRLIHKLARDMAQSVTVPSHWTTVQVAGLAVPVLVRPGLGAYLVLAQRQRSLLLHRTALGGAGGRRPRVGFRLDAAPLVPGAQLYDANFKYPVYLDKWSDKGMGTWYILGGPFRGRSPRLEGHH